MPFVYFFVSHLVHFEVPYTCWLQKNQSCTTRRRSISIFFVPIWWRFFRLKSGFPGGQGPWKFNSSPLRIHHPKMNAFFQPSFFRAEMSNFRGCTETEAGVSADCVCSLRGGVVPSENMDIECPGSKKNISEDSTNAQKTVE